MTRDVLKGVVLFTVPFLLGAVFGYFFCLVQARQVVRDLVRTELKAEFYP